MERPFDRFARRLARRRDEWQRARQDVAEQHPPLDLVASGSPADCPRPLVTPPPPEFPSVGGAPVFGPLGDHDA